MLALLVNMQGQVKSDYFLGAGRKKMGLGSGLEN